MQREANSCGMSRLSGLVFLAAEAYLRSMAVILSTRF